MQTAVLPTTSSQTAETAEQAHLRRLHASLDRARRDAAYYAARKMWTSHRKAQALVAGYERALASAEGWC